MYAEVVSSFERFQLTSQLQFQFPIITNKPMNMVTLRTSEFGYMCHLS
jgi:hypothetical protein